MVSDWLTVALCVEDALPERAKDPVTVGVAVRTCTWDRVWLLVLMMLLEVV